MSMFRRRDPEPSRPSAGAASGALERDGRTRIAPGSKETGEMGGATELLIDGEVEGRVKVESDVVVGPTGMVRGPIAARVVRVLGRVVGDVRGSERVEVEPGGTLEGDIAAPRVVIAEGAFFTGKVEMKGE